VCQDFGMTGAHSPLVVGLGESLLRLSAPGRDRLGQAGWLDVHVGGAEMNALIAAAGLGARARWATRLADNPVGRRICAHATLHGVDAVVDWDAQARAPLYFVEHGSDPRPSEVLYDRRDTAMCALTPATLDLEALVRGASAVLSSGITCALGAGPAHTVRRLFQTAREAGVRTAFDVNHRSRMWAWEEAAPVLRDVLADVDILFATDHDLARLVDADGPDGSPAGLARAALRRFGHHVVVVRDTVRTGPSRVAVTVRVVGADGEWAAGPYEADVVDAFGGGDAAVGAFLAALLRDDGVAEAARRSAWACALQHTFTGDAWQGRESDLAPADATPGRILR
jgi:2-dehydro-3-deoxygluconokinase